MKDILSFNSKDYCKDETKIELMGLRGKRLMELASLGLPILPGFVIPNEALSLDMDDQLENGFQSMASILGKAIGDEKSPLLFKVVVSPMLNVPVPIASIHNIGLCDKTLDGFAGNVGEDFAQHEYRNLIAQVLNLYKNVTDNTDVQKKSDAIIAKIKKTKSVKASKAVIEEAKELLPDDVFDNAFEQFKFVLGLFKKYFDGNDVIIDSAILIQAMTFGNYGNDSFFGHFYTRDIVFGDAKLSGEFFINSFDSTNTKGSDILKIKDAFLKKLQSFGESLEVHYKEIRFIKFTVEDGKLWIIDQSSAPGKSSQAEIRTLLDLLGKKKVSKEYVIQTVKTPRLAEILHPILDKKSATKIPKQQGGISGAMGAAIGRVFFSTEALINEYRMAVQNNLDTNLILCMPATYAEDVKAIEIANGVLTQEGGYASHAPVVARSLGKIAMVRPDIQFGKKSIKIGSKEVKEGDYISLDVPSYDEPTIYFGKVDLIQPDIEKSGLLEFLSVTQEFIEDFDVYANADQPKDAVLATKFNAKGIGLCRTEHMFFDEKRIPIFRSMILAETSEERIKILNKLKVMQKKDFYDLFKIMGEKPVTIRLLDAPLHEFLPHTKETMNDFIEYMKKQNPSIKPADIKLKCDLMNEVNPMLGHRGVRLAISYPEIYKMQVEAIFEAAYELREKEKITCTPDIMIPIVMTEREVKTIRFGKKIEGTGIDGIVQIEESIRGRLKAKPIDYKVGTMIELPAAAVQADKIARYADFFSFGTNDLTQTTTGLSRDDFNSFFTDYNEFDLLEKNPFQFLSEAVKEMIRIAVLRGRITRPDIKLGLCGEQGAEPSNIEFLKDAGLHYVSCSPYGIPVAKLTIAQLNLKAKDAK